MISVSKIILETLVIVVSFSCVYSSMIYDLCILETLVIVVSFSSHCNPTKPFSLSPCFLLRLRHHHLLHQVTPPILLV
jgi:hypothetical protein